MSFPCDLHVALERLHCSKRFGRRRVGGFAASQECLRVDLIPAFNSAMEGRLPGLFGIELRVVELWDAVVRRASDGKDLALFRCTQYLLPANDPRTAEQAKRRGDGGTAT